MNNRKKRLIVQIFCLVLAVALTVGIFVSFFQMKSVEEQLQLLEEYSTEESAN
ncbi:MAG: hypothetical protein GX909_00670 [Clostridiaceae bacterium]|nr:hypothetical protein [Clostridiaceae bacterium]